MPVYATIDVGDTHHTKPRWRALGYPKMESETITLPPPGDFRRVYHMMKAKWALDAVEDQRLRVSRFADLNDPFELFPVNRHTHAARKASKAFARYFWGRRGLLSFGGDWSSPVMWSHYAENHRGICLGLDVRRDSLEQVCYEAERLRFTFDEPFDPAAWTDDTFRTFACTKGQDWSYENEFRRLIDLSKVVSEPPDYFIPFDDDMRLAEVIIGERCEAPLAPTRERVCATAPSAVTFKARLAYRSFRVVLNGRTRPPDSPQG
ncbi:MAG: DUF2971 domain-containing protein [Acidimicrobiia bacterium]|nr:DUF2971 domain-containing protein [Acidimicrobiia bacterium]